MTATASKPGDALYRRLAEATVKHAQLLRLAERLPDQISTAAREVEEAYRALGITPPTAASKAPGATRAPRRGGVVQEITGILDGGNPMTVAQIAEAAGRRQETVADAVTRLLADGTLTAAPNPNGRGRLLSLATEAGS